jgi:hypothetical protein
MRCRLHYAYRVLRLTLKAGKTDYVPWRKAWMPLASA